MNIEFLLAVSVLATLAAGLSAAAGALTSSLWRLIRGGWKYDLADEIERAVAAGGVVLWTATRVTVGIWSFGYVTTWAFGVILK